MTLAIDPPELHPICVLHSGAIGAMSHTVAKPRLVPVCELDRRAVEAVKPAFVVVPAHIAVTLPLSHGVTYLMTANEAVRRNEGDLRVIGWCEPSRTPKINVSGAKNRRRTGDSNSKSSL
jgi:hypothetical protein